MYDNSATLSLTGSGITILGQGAGVMVLTVAGVFFLVLGGVLSLTGRHTGDTES
jgi:hypothetical protein